VIFKEERVDGQVRVIIDEKGVLHWLPIEQRIKFKLATLTHNTLCSTQPAYLHSLLNYRTPTRSLRSANANLLSVPCVRTTFASRAGRANHRYEISS